MLIVGCWLLIVGCFYLEILHQPNLPPINKVFSSEFKSTPVDSNPWQQKTKNYSVLLQINRTFTINDLIYTLRAYAINNKFSVLLRLIPLNALSTLFKVDTLLAINC
ncbi:hypothetical protein CEN40_17205 [Fischerella thermalis CCMEE 5205]|nr:hypothetical protein CEN40_17205 [Fischerella thermalis CCMEE 5205]